MPTIEIPEDHIPIVLSTFQTYILAQIVYDAGQNTQGVADLIAADPDAIPTPFDTNNLTPDTSLFNISSWVAYIMEKCWFVSPNNPANP